MPHVALPGSTRHAPHDATPAGELDPSQKASVTLYLRRKFNESFKTRLERHAEVKNHGDFPSFAYHDDFCECYGASDADVDAVKAVAARFDLEVVDEHQARRSVVLKGSLERLQAAFKVELKAYQKDGRTFRGREGAVHIPAELQDIVTGVFGLDDRPAARPQFRKRIEPKGIAKPRVAATSYNPPQVAQGYRFPIGVDGTGECIALIELSGGYQPFQMSNYFLALPGGRVPVMQDAFVGGGQNAPDGPRGYDAEVQLDGQVAGSIAPGAKLKFCFAPNTDQGFLDVINLAIHDPEVTIISISYGSPTRYWTRQSLDHYNSAFQDAVALGKTVLVASGDNGSGDGVGDGLNHVDFPAASPWVLACGGTTLETIGGGEAATIRETVWNETANGGGATGGGYSGYFPRPAYQPGKGKGSRGVPDVAGNGDPQTGYNVAIDGMPNVISGTSAVAPLYAALFACINQALLAHGKPRVGFANPVLYANPSAFRDITQGNNGAFSAGPGWDACTGLGSPNGQKILAAFLGIDPRLFGTFS